MTDTADNNQRPEYLEWTDFYTGFATKLLPYRNKRKELIDELKRLSEETRFLNYLKTDEYPEGGKGFVRDICPFTFIGTFNRNIKNENRLWIAGRLAEFLGVEAAIPENLEVGIPTLHPMKAMFFAWEKERKPDDIDTLWHVFSRAIEFADQGSENSRLEFVDTYDKAMEVKCTSWNLTMGLFWTRPLHFVNLDTPNYEYIYSLLNPEGKKSRWEKQLKTGKGYLELRDLLLEKFKDPDFPAHSFPELSYKAWQAKTEGKNPNNGKSGKTSPHYWLIAPGENAKFWDEWKEKDIISIGWDKIGNLKSYNNEDEIYTAIKTQFQEKNPVMQRKACYEFANCMNAGDYVIVKTGFKTLLGYGTVAGDYEYDESRAEHRNIRKVRWIKTGSWEFDFSLDKDVSQFVAKTLTDLTKYPGFGQQFIDYMNKSDAKVSYYWLNANPNIWRLEDLEVGGKILYTSHNESGHKRRIYKHFEAVKPGDEVLGYVSSPERKIVCICKVTKPLHESAEGEAVEFEKIKTLEKPVEFSELQSIDTLSNSEPMKNNQGTLFKLTPQEYQTIKDLIESRKPPEPEPYTLEMAMDGLFMGEETFTNIVSLLEAKKNVILQGAPGVGKTFIARRLAYYLMGVKDESRVAMIQFHQSYSYEDFIQGYRPDDGGKFVLQNGVFYNFCEHARQKPEEKYVFIIDEINRGNLSKILGELMMLIESDKRGEEFAIPLAYGKNGEKFSIAQNVYLLGTMNTADRSLAMVDYALRRRFAFITLEPYFASRKFVTFLAGKGISQAIIESIKLAMQKLNEEIRKESGTLGEGFCIGHSFFCPEQAPENDTLWLERIFNHEIKPLIEEYWFDNQDKANEMKQLLSPKGGGAEDDRAQ
jgi:5-methylcytosine-specific restriction enzyme B